MRSERKRRKSKPLRSVRKSVKKRNNRCSTKGSLSAHR
nr:MAG TPA: hypothetical protein [Caudoviricetes sp.]